MWSSEGDGGGRGEGGWVWRMRKVEGLEAKEKREVVKVERRVVRVVMLGFGGGGSVSDMLMRCTASMLLWYHK